MESAEIERTTVDITAKVAARLLELRATGSVVKFDGFLKLYQEGRDDDPEDEESRRLPAMSAGEPLTKKEIAATQHFTEPPPRYSEASLVKRMEELGIGRPSTYASILQVLKDRNYVRIDKRRLVPEDRGRIVIAFLESFFARYVEYDFTADLEEQLDRVSNNEVEWRELLREFWIDFTGAVGEIKDLQDQPGDRRARRDAGAAHLSAARRRRRSAPSAPPAAPGACRSSSASSAPSSAARTIRNASTRGRSRCPAPMASRRPRRGRSDAIPTGSRSRCATAGSAPTCSSARRSKARSPSARAFCAASIRPTSISRRRSSCCRCRAKSAAIPKTASRSSPAIGRYGPYIQHGKTYANLETGDDVFNIGLNRAVTLIAEKVAKGPRGPLRRRSRPLARRSSGQGRRGRS